MKFGSPGQGDGEFNRPSGIAVDKEGIIYVTDFKNDRLQIFNADGSFITELTGDATLSKWGRERLELDPGMMRGPRAGSTRAGEAVQWADRRRSR